MNKLVSILLVNFNNNQYTIDCLNSLMKLKYPNFEIIITDNGSTRANFIKLKNDITQFSTKLNIKLIRSNVKLYFAGGTNKAIKESKGEYICLLNNDTEVESDFLDIIIDYLQVHEDVGMLCPKIVYYEKPNYIWYAGAYLNPRSIYFTYHYGLSRKDNGQFDQITETAYANGAALFIRKEVIQKIGLLDEIFFMYAEEVDWNLRAREAGYKLIYFPITRVYHKIDPVSKENRLGYRGNYFQMYLYTRNKIILTLKHFSWINIMLFFLIYQERKTIFEILYSVFKNRHEFFIAHVRALLMGSLIGFKRRTHRQCHRLMIKEYKYLDQFQTYRK
jgi:GT2 family glycosyltransferase